jgi:hypothetical protein
MAMAQALLAAHKVVPDLVLRSNSQSFDLSIFYSVPSP